MIRRCFRIFFCELRENAYDNFISKRKHNTRPKKIPLFAFLSAYFRRICVSSEKSTEKNTCRSGDTSQTARV